MVPDQYPPGYHFSQPHSIPGHPESAFPSNASQYYGHSYAIPQHPPATNGSSSSQHNDYYTYQQHIHAPQRRDSHLSSAGYDDHSDAIIDPALRAEEELHAAQHQGYQTVPDDYADYRQSILNQEYEGRRVVKSPSTDSNIGYGSPVPRHDDRRESEYPFRGEYHQGGQSPQGSAADSTCDRQHYEQPPPVSTSHRVYSSSGSRHSRDAPVVLPPDMPKGTLSGEKYNRHLAKLHASQSPDSDHGGDGEFNELMPEPVRDFAAEANADPHMPSPYTFDLMINEYLRALSPKKREKALLHQTLYDTVLECLKDPKETGKHTAQFRYWCRKMFNVQRIDGSDMLLHENKPVAVREQIYEVLVHCHRQAAHGGRDKTSNEVRKYYSWIPKDVIARFVRDCPFCRGRRTQSSSSLGPMTDAQVNLLTLQVNESNRGEGPARRISLAEARAAAQREGHRPFGRGGGPARNGAARCVAFNLRSQRQERSIVKYDTLPDTVEFNNVELPAQGITHIGQQSQYQPSDYFVGPDVTTANQEQYEAYYGPSRANQTQQAQQYQQAEVQQFQMSNLVQAQALVQMRQQNHNVMMLERRASVYEPSNSLGLQFGSSENGRRWSEVAIPSQSVSQQHYQEVSVSVGDQYGYDAELVAQSRQIPQIVSHTVSEPDVILATDEDSLSDIRSFARQIAEAQPASGSPERLAAEHEAQHLEMGQYDPSPLSVNDSLPEISITAAHINTSLGLSDGTTSYWQVSQSPTIRSQPVVNAIQGHNDDPFGSHVGFAQHDYEYHLADQRDEGLEEYLARESRQHPLYHEHQGKMVDMPDADYQYHQAARGYEVQQ